MAGCVGDLCARICSRLSDLRGSMWNSERKEVFGRDGLSWVKITFFYFVFYAVLGAFCAVLVGIFTLSIDEQVPSYKFGLNVLSEEKATPGMGFHPMAPLRDVADVVNLIKYNASWESKYNASLYVNTLHRYLHHFNVTANKWSKLMDCTKDRYKNNAVRMKEVDNGMSCIFNLQSFGPNNTACVEDNLYGYSNGTPCVIVKLNRIYDWQPKAYTNDTVPAELRDIWMNNKKDHIYVTCKGENAADVDNLGDIKYYSLLGNDTVGGLPFYYYPYRNQKGSYDIDGNSNDDGYRQPLVFIHLANISKNKLVNIECRAWAANIEYNRAYQQGSVHFEVLVD